MTQLHIELVAHVDAGDRNAWRDEQDRRPLSDLGRRQAAMICEALGAAPVDALYSSPALRCHQTLQPLAERFGLTITDLPGLHETQDFLPPVAWRRRQVFPANDPLGGAYAAGLAMQALSSIRAERASGRVIACTHGDILPSLIVYLMGAYGLELPAPHATRGGWYTLTFEDGSEVSVEHHPVLSGFPL